MTDGAEGDQDAGEREHGELAQRATGVTSAASRLAAVVSAAEQHRQADPPQRAHHAVGRRALGRVAQLVVVGRDHVHGVDERQDREQERHGRASRRSAAGPSAPSSANVQSCASATVTSGRSIPRAVLKREGERGEHEREARAASRARSARRSHLGRRRPSSCGAAAEPHLDAARLARAIARDRAVVVRARRTRGRRSRRTPRSARQPAVARHDAAGQERVRERLAAQRRARAVVVRHAREQRREAGARPPGAARGTGTVASELTWCTPGSGGRSAG